MRIQTKLGRELRLVFLWLQSREQIWGLLTYCENCPSIWAGALFP